MIFLRFSPYKWLMYLCSCVEFKEKRTERAPWYTSAWARLQRSSNTELAQLTIWRLHDVAPNCTIGLSCVSLFLRCPELFIAPCKEIWNLGNFACGIRHRAQGVWNTINDLNSTDKDILESGTWNLKSEIHGVESRIQGSLPWGDDDTFFTGSCKPTSSHLMSRIISRMQSNSWISSVNAKKKTRCTTRQLTDFIWTLIETFTFKTVV